jgi:hypothetical protein
MRRPIGDAMRHGARRLAALLLTAAALLPAAAAAPPAPPDDLYLLALEAISEGRRGDAADIVTRMLDQGARHAGEYLDLALLQCALGREDDAETLFRTIETRFAPPPGISDIIRRQRTLGCQPWRPVQQWSATVGRGRDNNVNQGAANPYFELGGGGQLELLPEYLPRGDDYSVLSGEYLRDLGDNGDLGFAQVHLRRHDHVSDYDTASAFVGAEHAWRLGRWRLRSSALLGVLSLGGQLYQNQGQAQLRAIAPLPLPESLELSMSASATRNLYRTLSNFNATTLETRGMLNYRDGGARVQFSLGLQDDRGNAARPGGDRDGWSAALFAHAELPGALQGELDLSRQTWRGDRAYAPGLIEERRHQAINTARATLIYPLGPQHSLNLEWRRVDNRENISIFRYRSQQLQLSWRWNGR